MLFFLSNPFKPSGRKAGFYKPSGMLASLMVDSWDQLLNWLKLVGALE